MITLTERSTQWGDVLIYENAPIDFATTISGEYYGVNRMRAFAIIGTAEVPIFDAPNKIYDEMFRLFQKTKYPGGIPYTSTNDRSWFYQEFFEFFGLWHDITGGVSDLFTQEVFHDFA